MTRGAVYLRPSIGVRMCIEQQEAMVRQAIKGRAYKIVAVHRERYLTARARRHGLPVRNRLLTEAGKRFEVLLLADLSQLGRDLGDLVKTLGHHKGQGVEVLVLGGSVGGGMLVDATSLDTASRRYRIEAVAEGRQRAQERGVRLGRPPVPPDRIARV